MSETRITPVAGTTAPHVSTVHVVKSRELSDKLAARSDDAVNAATSILDTQKAVGLYDPRFEHDACGVSFIVDMHGRASHEIVSTGLSAAQLGPKHKLVMAQGYCYKYLISSCQR